MTCTLSVDHRAVDGKVGSELLQAFKNISKTPALIVMEGM
ncbi:MAG: 2-oxo acid dehydrogenase subunit E2 [Holosporaceae bacterium]|nr:MAG: 2-oxo acid dehydrogenase subunit E2 [Holosporaceae bacterium]